MIGRQQATQLKGQASSRSQLITHTYKEGEAMIDLFSGFVSWSGYVSWSALALAIVITRA